MVSEKDIRILEQLRRNSKSTTQQISNATGIPVTTVHNRIRKMEEAGIIKGYGVSLDHKKLGYDILAFIMISVSYISSDGKRISQDELARNISEMPYVEEAHIVTGGVDIIAKVRVQNMDVLNDFVINQLRNLNGVENTETVIVLKSLER